MSINVEKFILDNYTPYDGDNSFLKEATDRTKYLSEKIKILLNEERKNGGVLKIDTSRPSSILSHPPGYIEKEKELIVGLQTDEPLKRAICPFSGLRNTIQACKAYNKEVDKEVLEKFKYRTTHNDGVFRLYTKEMKDARHAGLLTGLPDAYGRGRLIGDYRRIPLYGMAKLIYEKEQDKIRIGQQDMTEENMQLLEDLAKQIEFMKQLVDMAQQYGYYIDRPAENAREAIQWLYFGYLGAIKEQNGAANSIGRISTFLDIYIENDLKKGILNEIEAQELIDDFILKLRLVRHLRTPEYNELFAGDPVWVTCSLGGVAVNGKHMITKTDYRILNTLYNLGPSAEPNITVLWSEFLPENFKKYCAKVSIDTSSIQYENDDVMSKDFGNDYSIACCVSAMKTGKQMQYFGARCNLPKVLLLTLNDGKDEIQGKQIAPALNFRFEGTLDYIEVLHYFKKRLSWMAKLYVNTMNVIHYAHDKYAYERLIMSLHDTEVERLMAFGVSGLSVLVDSLSAIKYAKVTPIRDERDIIIDFDVEGEFPKFGNDDDRVDNIAKWVTSFFYEELCRTKAYRNAKHTLSILTITSNVVYGKKTGSTPDGRKAGKPFAPGANPMHGRDTSGALASLNSVAKLDYKYCQDGISNTFSIVPQSLGNNNEDRINNLIAILDGYFIQNAHHLNVNIMNRETLELAMKDPDSFPNLTIRVSGYAVLFNSLDREKQLEVISRTFHNNI